MNTVETDASAPTRDESSDAIILDGDWLRNHAHTIILETYPVITIYLRARNPHLPSLSINSSLFVLFWFTTHT